MLNVYEEIKNKKNTALKLIIIEYYFTFNVIAESAFFYHYTRLLLA